MWLVCGEMTSDRSVPGLGDTQLSKSGLLLELHGAQIVDRRVPASWIVEAFDVVEYVRSCFVALLPARSVINDEKKLSMAALPHTLPDRLPAPVYGSNGSCSKMYRTAMSFSCAHSTHRVVSGSK
jgi:hypothetical protein